MKKILSYLGIILFIGCSCINKTSTMKREYIGHVLLIPKHIPIPIYNSYKGDIIGYAINDTITESYAFIAISEIKDNHANVVIDYPLENNRKQYGWIETRYLGIHLAFDAEPLKIMSQPNSFSKASFIVYDPQWGDYYPIIDAHDGWLKIKNVYNQEEAGWIAPEYQCNNPYTSCN